MDLVNAAVLGLIQGLTEFLPISSSGHLALAQLWLGLEEPQLLFDLFLHVGTLVALIAVYYRDLADIAASTLRASVDVLRRRASARQAFSPRSPALFGWLVVVATIPTGIIGLTFKKQFEESFVSPVRLGLEFLVTAAVLWFLARDHGGNQPLDHRRALLIGAAQGISASPAISRSGVTVAAGLALGLTRVEAARFSFIASIPAILAAFALKLVDYWRGVDPSSTHLGAAAVLIGSGVAMVSGYASLRVLLDVVRRGRFHLFAIYCLLIGIASMWWGLARG